MSTLKLAAMRLYRKNYQDYLNWFNQAVDGDFSNNRQPIATVQNNEKLWFWACKRWKDFPRREYELRDQYKRTPENE